MNNGLLVKKDSLQLEACLAFFTLFLFSGLSIFVAPTFIPGDIVIIYRVCVTLLFLLFAVMIDWKNYPKEYFHVFFDFFIASFVTFLDSLIVLLGWISGSTVDSMFLGQLLSTVLIFIPIVLLTKISGNDLASIYLKKGRFRLGLIFGLGTFLFLLTITLVDPRGASVLFPVSQDLTDDMLISLMPWVVVFVLLNGLREELWFRGVFLKKYETFLGANAANFLQASIFSIAHIGVQYTPVLLIFLAITFLLGLTWGFVMQKTDSLLGSALFHAAMDIPVILRIFSNL